MDFKPLKSLEIHLQALVEAKLYIKVLVAMFLGIAVGFLLGPNADLISPQAASAVGEWLALPGKLFLKLVQMIMIPLIFASIITGLVSASGDQIKKMGIGVGLYFISTTAISILLGVFLALTIKPGKILDKTSKLQTGTDSGDPSFSNKTFDNIPTAISELLPENPLASMVSGEMLAIVIFTIIIGVAVMQINESMRESILRILSAIQEICMTIVKWAMKLVPYAVFGLMAQVMASIGLSSLQGIGLYILTVFIGLFCLLILYLLIVFIFSKQNPFSFLGKIKDVQLLAFSTTSSAAVMPLSIKTAQEKLNVSTSVSNFLIPVGATVNMDGTALYQCISTIFIAQAYGIDISTASIMFIMITIVAASIGTPAIPGGGVIILATVLQSAGIPAEGIIIIIGVERILGMFRTAINVTGDLTACIVFNTLEAKWKKSTLEKPVINSTVL